MQTASLCREKAARLRVLALWTDIQTANLLALAVDYEGLARKLEPDNQGAPIINCPLRPDA